MHNNRNSSFDRLTTALSKANHAAKPPFSDYLSKSTILDRQLVDCGLSDSCFDAEQASFIIKACVLMCSRSCGESQARIRSELKRLLKTRRLNDIKSLTQEQVRLLVAYCVVRCT